MNRFDEISALLQKGRPRELSALVQEELADGTAANDILTKAFDTRAVIVVLDEGVREGRDRRGFPPRLLHSLPFQGL